ncbi:MAG TPA: YfhO family protein [Patescibacteria group bacterium]|nr:YfhO family protein [Patescibacteria group bacterium]
MKKYFNFLLSLSPYVFLLMLLVILFWQVFFQGFVFIDGDNFHLNIPLKYFLVDSIKKGDFPFWNPYILGGMPYAADLNVGTFNPFNFLYFLFPIPRALTLHVILDLFLIGSFEFMLLKQKVSRYSALLGAIIFMLSGTVFLFTSNVTILHVILFIPLLFLFVEKFTFSKKAKYFLLLILTQVLQIISGHPQITYYTIFFISLYILFQKNLPFYKRFWQVVFYIIFSVSISSFQLIPFFELVLHSSRPINSLAYASSGSLSISHIITIFFPTFFGTKLFGTWWGSQITLFGYISVAGLLFLLVGLFSTKFKDKNFFAFSLMLSFLLSFGKAGILFFLFYYLVPGWSAFRSPADVFVMTTFFAAIFAAEGFEYILQKQKMFKRINKHIVFTCTILLIFIFAIWLVTAKAIAWTRVFMFLKNIHTPLVGKILFYSPAKINTIFSVTLFNMFFFTFFLLMLGLFLWKVPRKRKAFPFLVIIFVSTNLLFFDKTYLQLAPLSFYSVRPPEIPNTILYRIFSKPVVLKQDRRYVPGPKYFYNEAQLNLNSVTDNHVVPLGIQGVTGYTSLVLATYEKFVESTNVTGIDANKLNNAKLAALSAKYIVETNKEGNVIFVENKSALPIIRLEEQSEKNTIFVKGDTSNKISIEVFSDKPNKLIISDNYYPGWTATINGEPTTISLYNKIFRQVNIPNGKSDVIVYYDPFIWKIGTLISFASFVFLFILLKIKKLYV